MNQAQLKSFLDYCGRFADRERCSILEQTFDETSNRVKIRLIDDCDSEEIGAFFVEYAGEFAGRPMLHLTDCVYGEHANYFCEAQPEILIAMMVEM